MSRRNPRWRVTYILVGGGRRQRAEWMVRAPSEEAAVELAQAERAAWDAERDSGAHGDFDNAFVVPYTTSDAMDDGTSPWSVVIWAGMVAFTILAYMGLKGNPGLLPTIAAYGWMGLEWMCLIGFAGLVLFWAVAAPCIGVMMLRDRLRRGRERV